MLSDRENISHQMQSTLDEATDPWGVKVERVEASSFGLLAPCLSVHRHALSHSEHVFYSSSGEAFAIERKFANFR